MKREEIEHLLADYANGTISAAAMKRLEELFSLDPLLKQEAEEMKQVWDSIGEAEENIRMSPGMDADFYAMLKTAKKDSLDKNHRIIVLRPNLIRLLVTSAACISAFLVGRVSVAPVEVMKYKTVYVKEQSRPQPAPVSSPEGKSIVKENAENEYKLFVADVKSTVNKELRQKLRSVYASERIAAINELSRAKSIDPEALKILGLALNEDPNTNVRLMIVNVLQPMAGQQDVQDVLISALNRQGDPLIQASLVDMLVEAKSKQAIPQMINLLQNKSTDVIVQERIKDGIEKFLY